MSEIEYPTIPRDERKTVKIKTTEYEKIKRLYQTGSTYPQIAEIYNVNYATIKKIIEPEWYEKILQKKRDYVKKMWASSLEFRKKSIKSADEFVENRKKKDERFADWVKMAEYKYRHSKRGRDLSKKWRLENQTKLKKYRSINKDKFYKAHKNWRTENTLYQLKHKMRQRVYYHENKKQCDYEAHRIDRVKRNAFFRQFWNLIEPDTRTKKEKHAQHK